MSGPKIVFYLNSSSLKIFHVVSNTSTLFTEIKFTQPDEVFHQLKDYATQSISLIVADEISYFFEETVSPPLTVDANFKNNLLNIVKSNIPEDFTNFFWDYQIIRHDQSSQVVQIFAPVKQYQQLINRLVTELQINFSSIEPESLAKTRHSDLVIGTTLKPDLKLPDASSINIVVSPPRSTSTNFLPLIIIIITIIATSFFFLTQYQSRQSSTILPAPTPTTLPTTTPTPQIILNLQIQNGTTVSGLAGQKAELFKNSHSISVTTANADNQKYLQNKLIFKNDSLKNLFTDQILTLIPIKTKNILIDTNLTSDAIVILGLN